MPADVLIRDILIPSIGNRVLVVHHADSETPFVDALVTHLRVSGGFIGISGIELVGPIDSDANEEARRRSDALRERYRSEEHTSELQSLMRNSYAAFSLKKKQ